MQGETRLLKIFTMNCWGIPVISKNRRERITALVDHLASCDYDFVCLQELWSEYDYHFIKEKTVDTLPYSHYFHSGVLGSGLCVISRFPIEDVFFHQWPMNGYMHKLQHGDWFGGKGIGVCRIQLEDVYVNVYTAHLHAEYNPSNDEYLAHRVLQALDAAQFVRLTAAGSDVAILGGDLNALPGDLAQRIICLYAELEDSCCVAHPTETHKNFGTNETTANSYTGKRVAREQPEGKRIDYVMFRTSSRVKVERVQYKHPLPDRVPQRSFSYSDHDAVLATLELSVTSPDVQPLTDESKPDPIPALTEGVAVCGSALRQLRRSRRVYWVLSLLFFIIVVCATVFDAPEAYDKILDVVIAVASILFCFTLFMCTLWNPIEVNAIRAGKLAMEVTLAAAELRLAGFVAQMEAAGAEHKERSKNYEQTRQSFTYEVDESQNSIIRQSDVLSNRNSRQSKYLLLPESKNSIDMGSNQLLLSESMDREENHTGQLLLQETKHNSQVEHRQSLLQETRHNSQGEHRQSVLIPNFSFLHKCWFRANSKP